MEPWDLVEIHGLVTATQLNGKFAFIRSYEKEEKRYQVEIKPDQPPVLIKRRNVKLVRQITQQVVRMNVDQGGTLKGGEDDWDTLLSFEWIDASEPSIDVDLDHTMEDFAWKPSSNCKEVSRKDLEQSRDKNLLRNLWSRYPIGTSMAKTKALTLRKVANHSIQFTREWKRQKVMLTYTTRY
ncbi:expressed unknown protein [Seminavis robusta]|uniref:Uncharacterized protein n=1 Tax=Seminavis robusta TaxID=568900 RepID=A0A9N8F3J4_9STRA|nr:expressed unknown protein [Seminavis robusta]|eukprot:Sro2987_g341700.1 n/a (182) ;mRNA; f:3194-3739